MKRRNRAIVILVLFCLWSNGCDIKARGSQITSPPPTTTRNLTPTPRPTATPTIMPTEPGDRFTSMDGSFSFVMADGWKVIEENDNLLRVTGPERGGFYPNFVVSQTKDVMMLEWWSATFQDDIKANLGITTQLSEDFIKTDTGETCFRWEFKAIREGIEYHHIFYMYESGDWKMVIGYTRLENAGEDQDAPIDAAMLTVLYSRE